MTCRHGHDHATPEGAGTCGSQPEQFHAATEPIIAVGVGMRGVKHSNEYARMLGPIYADIPKAVFAAIAVSFANRINEGVFDGVPGALMDEWQALHDNGIVPQRPPADLRYKFAGTSRSTACPSEG